MSWSVCACTGARPAEIVDNEKNKPADGLWEELWESNPSEASQSQDDEKPDVKDADEPIDENSRLLEEMLS